jgi:type VI secretion system protein ImpC
MAEAKKELEQGAVAEKDAFSALLEKEFKPKTAGARDQIQRASPTLAEQALPKPSCRTT